MTSFADTHAPPAPPLRIGVPRSLLYHRYHTLWGAFLAGIGCQAVVSPPTDAHILAEGCRLAPDEACLPVKLQVGHVAHLLTQGVDHVLVPRIVSLGRREENCQKFMGGYDLAANLFPDASFVTYTVDVRYGGRRERERTAMVALGRELGAGTARAAAAYERAHALQTARERAERRAARRSLRERDGRPTVLLVAHSYNLGDEFLGARPARLLEEQGVRTVSAEALHVRPRSNRVPLARDVYWTYSRELLAGIDRARGHVDGVLFLMTFPCGPDSLVTELCERRVRDLPLSTLVLDEHTSDVGVRTRLECFADIVRERHAARGAMPA